MNSIKKEHKILLFINLALLICFGILYSLQLNYEFIIYIGVISFFLFLVGITIKKVDYTLSSLIGLTTWSALHLAGGFFMIGDVRLYDYIPFPLSETYPILRYDQIVHIWGFGAATLVSFSMLLKTLKFPITHHIPLGIVLVMAGLGIGALNEIMEFGVSISVPESQIGGYMNTSLDLCADLIGAILGLILIRFSPKYKQVK